MKLEKIEYNLLNSKQKENYNFHKVASALADYGYNSLRLNDDWQGADFIAINGEDMLKVQLKGRFTVDKKYIGKEIYIAFIENNIIKLYKHDEAVKMLSNNIIKSKSWVIKVITEDILGAKLLKFIILLLERFNTKPRQRTSEYTVKIKPFLWYKIYQYIYSFS